MSARLPFLNLIAAATVVTGAAMLAGCGGGSSSSGPSGTNVLATYDLYMPEGAESPLPKAVTVDEDGNITDVDTGAFTIDGLVASAGGLTLQGQATLQAVSFQLPAPGSFAIYNEKDREREDGEGWSEWYEDTFNVTWEIGTVSLNGHSVAAIVAELDYGFYSRREAFTIANGWIWWMYDYGYGNLDIDSNDLAIIDDMIPWLPVNFKSGDAFHFTYKWSDEWDDEWGKGSGEESGTVEWRVASTSASSPNGYDNCIRIEGKYSGRYTYTQSWQSSEGEVTSKYTGRFDGKFTEYHKAGKGPIYFTTSDKDTESSNDGWSYEWEWEDVLEMVEFNVPVNG